MDSQSWDGLVVLASGVSWDDTWLVEKHMALQLTKFAPVLFVDPPMSWLTPYRKPQLAREHFTPRLRKLGHNLARLTPLAPPGITRPVMRDMAVTATRAAIRRATRLLGGRVQAIVVCSLDPLLNACDATTRVLWGTDDWVSGGALMGLSTDRLRRQEAAQLNMADLVIAVSPTLAERWRSRAPRLSIIGNGCDDQAFARSDTVAAASDILLPDPIAGYFGHLSDRINIDLLTAVAETGSSLLIVGRRQHTSDLAAMEALLAMGNVQWTGPRSFGALPSYMHRVKVGLTPYADSAFNRSSFPLKTLEYLAAGRAAIITDLPAAAEIPSDLVHVASDRASFQALTVSALSVEPDASLIRRRKEFAAGHSWTARGVEFAAALGL